MYSIGHLTHYGSKQIVSVVRYRTDDHSTCLSEYVGSKDIGVPRWSFELFLINMYIVVVPIDGINDKFRKLLV